jgi:hypothetical protein
MDKLKIVKLQEGVFKHIINDIDDRAFYNTEYCKMSIDNGTISINSGNFNRDFYISDIEVFTSLSSSAIPFGSVDEFVIALNNIGYPLINSDNSSAVEWDSIIPSSTATTDLFTYKLGTTTVLTKTITYTDNTKSTIQKIEKS